MDKLSSVIKLEEEDNNDNYLKSDLDIRVKNEDKIDLKDWFLQNTSNCTFTVHYDDLKEESIQHCIICDKYFNNSFAFYKHNLTHLKVPLIRHRIYVCDICSNFYKKENDLRHHVLTHRKVSNETDNHITTSLHECKVRQEISPNNTRCGHEQCIRVKYKYECKECNATFRRRRYLTRHRKRMHGDVNLSWRRNQKLQCPKCPSILSCTSHLTAHLANCHSDITYECKLCTSILKSKAYLDTHMKRVHYNDGKVHFCEICRKVFKFAGYVRAHMKKMHGSK